MNIIDSIKQHGIVKYIIDNGGDIKPLIVPKELTGGTGLLNPSVFLDGDILRVNIRHINYTLYHSELKRFNHQFGPLQYLHPEDDLTLTTVNYLGTLDDELNIQEIHRVDTSKLDVSPIWHFVGLEDCRLFRWDDKLYLCGVRRDTTDNGQGRMELSEIELTDNSVKEISRHRIPLPNNSDSYCEKNWMPVAGLPYHLVKWTNPTQLVKYDINTKLTETVLLDESTYITGLPDLRGGSQILDYGDYRLTITHETALFNCEVGRKDGRYRHRFIVWDKDWNIVKYTEPFSFIEAEIEFCCGATFYKGDLLVSFGFQDNSAYILKIPKLILEDILNA
jgi:hypothetical protein